MNIGTLRAARTLTRHLYELSECVPSAHTGDLPCPQCGARDAADGLDEVLRAVDTRPSHLRVVEPEDDAVTVLRTLWEAVDQDALPAELRARVEEVLS